MTRLPPDELVAWKQEQHIHNAGVWLSTQVLSTLRPDTQASAQMEEIDSSPASHNPNKRALSDAESPEKKPLNLKGTQFVMTTPPNTDGSSSASPTFHDNLGVRPGSPTPSSSTLSSVAITEPPSTSALARSSSTADACTGPPPAKKRKLSPSEKEQQKREKEARAVEKAAEKARKEAGRAEDKARKDEEKQAKDEEKRKKAEDREAKRREKELEEERKIQDKLKKERAQMRLGAFFQKPETPARGESNGESSIGLPRRKSLSLEPFGTVADQISRAASPCKSTTQSPDENAPLDEPPISDYWRYFLPFQLQTHSSMKLSRTDRRSEQAQEAFDHEVNGSAVPEKYDLGLIDSYVSLEQHFLGDRQTSRGGRIPCVRSLVDHVQGASQQTIDLTAEEKSFTPLDALRCVSRRYIFFDKDVRPAYFGSYTKIRFQSSARKLCRNPFYRIREDTNYDEDSEAEWEEPEEGEDLLDEEEDDDDSVGDAYEMDEFLDDEDETVKAKRKMITGDLVPESTGLCWENESGKILPSIEGHGCVAPPRGMRMGFLLPGFTGTTIDPFSSAYWRNGEENVTTSDNHNAVSEPSSVPKEASLHPGRPPLQPRPNSNGTLDSMLGTGKGGERLVNNTPGPNPRKVVRKPSIKTLSKEDLAEFRGFVVGDQRPKADLLKALKVR